MTKIVVIGAGSVVFGSNMLRDLFTARQELWGSTVSLVDVDDAALRLMSALAERLNEAAGRPFTFQATGDRCAALPGAQFVIISVAMNRYQLWQLDHQIPLRHGAKQVQGENGGPGGLFHAMRNIPLILNICRDIERLCPDAQVLNFTNPEGRLCLAATRYTGLRFIGLCHGIDMARIAIGCALDLPVEEIDPSAAGLNHFTWILQLRCKSTGEDLYPAFRRAVVEKDLREYPTDVEPWENTGGASVHFHGITLSRYLMETFGYWPSPTDDHVAEYLSYGWEYCGVGGYDFAWGQRRTERCFRRLVSWVNGELPIDGLLQHPSGERAVPIITGMLGNKHQHELSVNVPNHGCIANLPDWAVVEIPATVDASGVHGLPIGPLPEPIAAMCRTQVSIIDRVTEAGVHGDRTAALQALLLDPVITSARQAEAILNDMFEVEKEYLPQFSS